MNRPGDEIIVSNKTLIEGLYDRLVWVTPEGGKKVLCRIIESNETHTSLKVVPNNTKD